MRLVFAIPQGLEDPSGRGRYWPLARELARLGHEVTLLCLHPDLASCRERVFRRDGVDVRYVAQMHVRKHAGAKTYFPAWRLPLVAARGLLAMARALRSLEADALHIGKAQPTNGLAALVRPGGGSRRVYLGCDDPGHVKQLPRLAAFPLAAVEDAWPPRPPGLRQHWLQRERLRRWRLRERLVRCQRRRALRVLPSRRLAEDWRRR